MIDLSYFRDNGIAKGYDEERIGAMKLLQAMRDGVFCLSVECTPHSAADVKHVAKIAKGLPALNRKYAAQRLAFPSITLTQNPGGNLSYDHHAALAILRAEGLPEEIEVIPHVTGKDMNSDALTALLQALAEGRIETILALTGDVPSGRGVYELESVGLLQLVNRVNVELLKKAKTFDAFSAQHQLSAGAAVSPFKYTEGSLAMQYIKAAKKVREGASFLVCQAGWDSARSEKLITALAGEKVPVLGNALVINEAAGRFMQQLAGCVVTDALLQRLHGEKEDGALARAAQQVAMFRALGYGGVDLGKPGDFRSIEEIESIADQALAIKDWREFRDNLTFSPGEQPAPKVSRSAPCSWGIHNLAFEEKGALHGVAKAVLSPANKSAEHGGLLYRMFRNIEDFAKGGLYNCEHCGDCFLPENQYLCTWGACEKGLSNVPCGDADSNGICGNNKDRICVGEKIYARAVHYKALEDFKNLTLPPRIPSLENTASVLNMFFGRDHRAHENPLANDGMIQIAELVHASLPLAGASMKYMYGLGDAGFTTRNRGRLAMADLIATQAKEGGDFIDINIDALAAKDAPGFMRQMVRLVHAYGNGVPPCLDSSAPAVLEAGLDEWFRLGKDKPLRKPLVNSLTFSEPERYDPVLARRREHAFNLVCLLVGNEGPLKSSQQMVDAARTLFKRCKAAGFQSDEIFFDSVTLGIGTDGFMDGDGNVKCSHTRNSFLAIQTIRNDPEMKGVHAVLGVSNWVFGARKRRIGHLRAFIQVAKDHGLDAMISDVSKGFGVQPAPAELMEFVRMFVALDGTDASMDVYSEGMAKAREANWV